jgi:uncharacterized protein YbjT (DUF2867 family)
MIVVTGATGKVGRELTRELRNIGAPFRVGSRAPGSAEGAETVLFDFDRPETFAPALAGAEKLFLLTSGGTDREAAVVGAAKDAGVRHVVKLSVWGAEEDAFVIGRAHRAIEQEIEASGMSWTFLRPNGFMQNLTTYRRDGIRSRGVIVDSTGDSKWSIVDARDVGAVAAKALTEPGHAGRAYKLSGPEALSQPEMAEKISRAVGKPVRYEDVPDEEFRRANISHGVPAPWADALVDLNVYYRTGAGAPVTADVEEILGRKPRSFERFAIENASVWQ